MYTQMFISISGLYNTPTAAWDLPFNANVIICHSTATAMSFNCLSNVTPIGIEIVYNWH